MGQQTVQWLRLASNRTLIVGSGSLDGGFVCITTVKMYDSLLVKISKNYVIIV